MSKLFARADVTAHSWAFTNPLKDMIACRYYDHEGPLDKAPLTAIGSEMDDDVAWFEGVLGNYKDHPGADPKQCHALEEIAGVLRDGKSVRLWIE